MTAEEMLIREVASAICRAEGHSPLEEGSQVINMTSGTGMIYHNEKKWQDYIKHAVDAISSMREFEYMANLTCPPDNEI